MGRVERDWKCEIDGYHVVYDRNGGQKDGATSGARCDSKQVKMQLLAEKQAGQHEQRRDMTMGVPVLSNPLPNHSRRPRTHPNPPHRRGQLKMRPTRVTYPMRTYQVPQTRRSRFWRVEVIEHDVY